MKPNRNPPVSTTGARVISLRLSLNGGTLTFEQLSLVTAEQARLMLQTLFADRFKLAVRREKQEQPGYALTIGKNGSKLKTASSDGTIGATTSGYLRTFQKMPVSGLVNFLAGAARQPVIDQTGLKGAFDFTLDLTPASNVHPKTDTKAEGFLSFPLRGMYTSSQMT